MWFCLHFHKDKSQYPSQLDNKHFWLSEFSPRERSKGKLLLLSSDEGNFVAQRLRTKPLFINKKEKGKIEEKAKLNVKTVIKVNLRKYSLYHYYAASPWELWKAFSEKSERFKILSRSFSHTWIYDTLFGVAKCFEDFSYSVSSFLVFSFAINTRLGKNHAETF